MELTKSQLKSKRRYEKQYGIKFNTFADIDPITWWEYTYYGTPNGEILKAMPRNIYTEKNRIKICKNVFENILNLKTREDLLSINCQTLFDYKIGFSSTFRNSPIKILNACYPELNIKQYELGDVCNNFWQNDNNVIEGLEWFLTKNKHTLQDVVNMTFPFEGYPISTIRTQRFNNNVHDLWIWYFKQKGITINYEDFRILPNHYLSDKDNLIKMIRNYCENICDVSILSAFENNSLQEWVETYFNREALLKDKFCNNPFGKSSYFLLTLAYPIINENHLLFEWEFRNVKKWGNKDYRIQGLRELVLYRLKLNNLAQEVPKYLTSQFLKNIGYTKFIYVSLDYYNTSNFYLWAIDAFPEFTHSWSEEDFGKVYIAKDGEKCNSVLERSLYEFIKFELDLNVKSIGTKRNGEFSFVLPDNHIDNRYFPDFVIKNDDTLKNEKPIIIEFYGMYDPNNKMDVYLKYNEKIKRKNQYYHSHNGIIFLDIYPFDLRYGFLGVKNKLDRLKGSSKVS